MVGSTPSSTASSVSGLPSTPSLPWSTHAPAAGWPVLPPVAPIRIDPGHGLYPLFVNRFVAGPVRLASIAHAFNYRIAVLRDGAKQATQTARSRKAVSWTMFRFFGANRWR